MALKIFFTSQTDVEILHSHISMAIADCLHWNRCTKYPTDDDAVPDQTREKLVFCTNRAVDAISLQKDCQRCEQKHLITKHSIFMRRMGLPSGSCCHCFCVYVTANIPFIAIHNSQFTIQMAALFEQSVYYIYVRCVCWLRLERKYSKRVHSSELIFTCLCVCNRGIFVRLMSSVPWPMHLTITIGPIQLSA